MNIKFNKKYTHEEFFNPDFQNWLQKNMPVGKIRVDSNPYNQGKQVELYYFFDHIDNFSTYIINQDNINGVYYCFDIRWKEDYTGTFTLLNPYQNIKPEVYEVGDTVEVLENLKDCRNFIETSVLKNHIGDIFTITEVFDDYSGICYTLDSNFTYPHYCLKKVNISKLKETINIDGIDYTLSEIKKALKNL